MGVLPQHISLGEFFRYCNVPARYPGRSEAPPGNGIICARTQPGKALEMLPSVVSYKFFYKIFMSNYWNYAKIYNLNMIDISDSGH